MIQTSSNERFLRRSLELRKLHQHVGAQQRRLASQKKHADGQGRKLASKQKP